MNNVSVEQSIVINHIKNGKNVVVDACAGSGKSTTILSCAKQMPEKKFLQITYNSMLRMEIKEKVKALDLQNIVVHTYHSLAVSKYSKNAFTDTGLRQVLYQNMDPLSSIKHQDVIVLDEAQDMTFLYFQFVVKYCRDMDTPFQVLILGDYMQGLYEFKGADIRFLTMAQEIWNGFPLLKTSEFMKCTLKISYRITRPMSDFINKVMLGEDRMEACKDGKPVLYIRNSKYFLQRTIVYNILELIKSGVNPSSIFVLGASVKGVNSQIRRIENVLVEAGIPCHVPMLETDKIDEKVISGKVVFSTFHCVKGRQRPYVFVIGFDNSYFNSYAKTNNPTQCPNTLYVASTRAEEGLFLLERADLPTDQPLKFLKMDHNEMKNQH
jgi:superfamily I DNA/RNA helicase